MMSVLISVEFGGAFVMSCRKDVAIEVQNNTSEPAYSFDKIIIQIDNYELEHMELKVKEILSAF